MHSGYTEQYCIVYGSVLTPNFSKPVVMIEYVDPTVLLQDYWVSVAGVHTYDSAMMLLIVYFSLVWYSDSKLAYNWKLFLDITTTGFSLKYTLCNCTWNYLAKVLQNITWP